ncbi:hypothetical protein B0H98_10595 [Vreelandella songnenensis]|uniref:PIN domain-containing protein n=2 Tax=Vreelandella songnenensis TaxID=1176243 RepID=A0A2T0V2P8_9GAMM|nr:hypothetical protein B0H98_10595 [Halomonas songnenensis]
MLKSMAQRDPEAAALVEAISIYGDLVEAEDHSAVWGTVSQIAASAKNDIVKDVCLAALLRLSRNTAREAAAKNYYLAAPDLGPYTREAFLRFYADESELEVASQKLFLSEGELTGIVEGALRLNLGCLAFRASSLLKETFPSYNASVLQVLARATILNKDIAQRHLWLNLPEVKQGLDDLSDQVVKLLELSEGTDKRLYDMACPIYECYQGLALNSLFEMLEKYLQYFEQAHPHTAARFKANAGDDSVLTKIQRDVRDAKESPQKQTSWCLRFLQADSHTLEEVLAFIRLATPEEIGDWLSKKTPINDASVMVVAFVRLLGNAARGAKQDNGLPQRHQLAEQVDLFLSEWGDDITSIAPERIFELADELFYAKLPHKALCFTSRLIPNQALWPSPFVLMHMKCLLEAQQYRTYDSVWARIAEAEKSLVLMSFQSSKAEQMGEITRAIEISDQMINHAPDVPYCWHRGCYLRDRYLSEADQHEFQQLIPDLLLQNYSSEVAGILYFLTKAGNFKRAESLWVEWFIKDPLAHAVELVDFHFGLSMDGTRRGEFELSSKMDHCLAAFQFEQDGETLIRLITDDYHNTSMCTLKASSQLGGLLQSLPIGESRLLGMVSYKVTEHLPPYLACVRIALQLRHKHNDGSDCFALLKMPSNTQEFIPFLEEKLGQYSGNRNRLNKIDNIPLYIRGYALDPNNPFKVAISCWTDVGISKSVLFSHGNAAPNKIVLDAYGIGYLAVTDLAQRMQDIGISFVLPAATKEALFRWVNEISDHNFMLLDVTDHGKLFRTTALDLQARSGHILKALRLILANASVAHPVLHDTTTEIYSIKDGIDSTVYDAIQLSLANDIPWFCMDGAFAALHYSNRNATANAQAIVEKAIVSSPFCFEHKRHGLLLYAFGALPLPLTFSDIHHLAAHSNTLSGFILFKIIQNHGNQIFVGDDRPLFLLDIILIHLNSCFHSGRSHKTLLPSYTSLGSYATHIFNHGISLFLVVNKGGTVESRLALAMMYMVTPSHFYQQFTKYIVGYFRRFAQGHFMDIDAINTHLQSLESQQRGLPYGRAHPNREGAVCDQYQRHAGDARCIQEFNPKNNFN